uniref:ATP synthase complex subunit 8 n=1 Tax=Epicalotermes sp. 2 AB-2022a TaxID=2942714 RepID=A0A8X8RHL8_9NEOP|nr:ATP synthase F0 subunit 8 [Epicalotermes sp. 2 AB-2022a]
MPQMMPMGWITLFIMFSSTLIIFAMTNYFSSMMIPKYIKKGMIMSKTTNWKW